MELTRRNFIASAAVLGTAAAVAGSASVANASEIVTAAERGSGVEPSSVDTTVEADVAVVGGGMTGLCAAVSAAQNGAKVVVLEKRDMLGGNGSMPEGLFAVNSPLQEAQGIESPTVLDIVKNEFQFNNFRITYDYWANFINGSGESIQWLLDLGAEFDPVGSMFGSPMVFHYGKDGHASAIVEALQNELESLDNITVLYETPGTALKMDDGKVAGVYGVGADGSVTLVSAPSVVLCSGGFSCDTAMVHDRVGYDTTYMQVSAGRPQNVGDGMAMALAAGAAECPSACLTAPRSAYDTFATNMFVVSAGQPYLWLNELGHRYIWEDLGTQSQCLVVRANMAQKKAFLIFDQAEFDRLCVEGPHIKRYRFWPGDPLEDLTAEIEEALQVEPDADGVRPVYKADTIEELAEMLGIDVEETVKSVDRYNELCEKGVDEDFGKDPQYLIPVQTGPFYAFRQTLECQSSIGGIDIDPVNRVLTPEGATIPGLWAGGSDGMKLTMETYNIEVPGSFLGYCVYSGRTMGQAAAEYALA